MDTLAIQCNVIMRSGHEKIISQEVLKFCVILN